MKCGHARKLGVGSCKHGFKCSPDAELKKGLDRKPFGYYNGGNRTVIF